MHDDSTYGGAKKKLLGEVENLNDIVQVSIDSGVAVVVKINEKQYRNFKIKRI